MNFSTRKKLFVSDKYFISLTLSFRVCFFSHHQPLPFVVIGNIKSSSDVEPVRRFFGIRVLYHVG